MIVFHASDLIWATRIKSTADDLGIPCRPVRSVEMLDARLADAPPPGVTGLIVDLDAPETAFALIERLRPADGVTEAGPTPRTVRIIAFGPHVEAPLLREARSKGVNQSITRGMLHANLAQILQDLAKPPAEP